MTKKYFGTDGIRGRVGEPLVSPEFVLKLGWAIGKVLVNGERKKILIGKDTRVSGYMLESALEAGLSAAGVDIHLLGPMPTPAISYLTRTLRANAGIVISASHNLFYDNGIKFFDDEGTKLGDDIELAIERQLACPLEVVSSELLGKAVRVDDAPGRYIEFCKSCVSSRIRLNGLKVVVDCANGATYHIAPNVFEELGAEVVEVASTPDGFNINDHCGSTHPELLQSLVKAEGADLGIALDGDGDRLTMVDEKGQVLDGDDILYIIIKNRLNRGKKVAGIVGTVMSNLGLEKVLNELGVKFHRASVGDRYVMEALLKKNWVLGGEPSGHIICRDKTQTGDGIISALQVLAAMKHSGKSLSQMREGLVKMPQMQINVETNNAKQVLEHPDIKKAICEAEAELNNQGRILLRASGTEPVTRVMVEGESKETVSRFANSLAEVVKRISLSI